MSTWKDEQFECRGPVKPNAALTQPKSFGRIHGMKFRQLGSKPLTSPRTSR
jgi:hypothetical protein